MTELKASATYKDYQTVYNKYKPLYGEQTAVFYQVGSFYELYDVVNKTTGITWCNVKDVVDILGIQLSIKPTNDENTEQLFAGFPDYTLHRWASKLTQQGWTVVVVEQKKDAKGKIEVREVTRILSPGTHYEIAQTNEIPYIATVWLEENVNNTDMRYGLTTIDLTTGSASSYEGSTRGKHNVWSADEAVHFFQIFPPKEVIIQWRGDSFTQPNEATLKRIFGFSSTTKIHSRQALPEQQGIFEKSLPREEFLRKHFNPQSLLPLREYLHIQSVPLVERSLCCLLRFVEEHFIASFDNHLTHIPWSPGTILHCGNNALSQLNFIGGDSSNSSNSSNSSSIIGLFTQKNGCITPMGKRGIRKRLLSPLTRKEEIDKRLERVDWFYNEDSKTEKQEVEQSLRFMYDLPRLHRKIMNFSIQGGDCLALLQTYTESQKLCDILAKVENKTLFDSPKKGDIENLVASWKEVFSKEKAEKTDEDISFIQTGVSKEIDTCEKKIQELYESVLKWKAELCECINITSDSLRMEEKTNALPIVIKGSKQIIQSLEKYFQKEKYNLQLTSDKFQNISFKQTKTVGHSIESPFIEKANHILLGLRSQLASLVKSVLPTICTTFYEATSSYWVSLENWIEEIDISLCFSKVAKEKCYSRPTIMNNNNNTGSSIKITDLRHPLIENLQNRSQYVTHNVSLGLEDGSDGWLLYGMNASGKSSLMKAIGIAVLLAQCGSYVPATLMELVPFERILTRILNVDNLWAGLSSFAVEISELRDIFMRANNRTLVLGDELCSGTETTSATALIAAGINYLTKNSSRFVFATHYHDLFKIPQINKLVSDKKIAVWHLRVRYDPKEDILIYERILTPGSGSTLYGIEVAKALGIPDEILEEAYDFRKILLGEVSEEKANGSKWNTNIGVHICEICGKKEKNTLEVHHIRERQEANGKKHFSNGLHRDAARNLIVLCEECHNNTHSGEIDIQSIQDTSVGQRRISSSTTKVKNSRPTEEIEKIQEVIKLYSSLSIKMLLHKLINEYSIDIKESELRKFKI